MKRALPLPRTSSTALLRVAVLGFAAAILALCVFALPAGIASDNAGMYRWILAGMYIPAIPFFYAIYETMKLLRYIDAGTAFSGQSVTVLKHIKYSAYSIAGLYAVGMPYVYYVADKDDAPGVVAIGCILVAASAAIAVLAAVLQQLLQAAIAIKSENDLTV